MWKAGCISLLPGLLGLVEMSDAVKNGNHLEPVNIIIKWKYNYYCLNPSVCMHPLYFQSPVLFTGLLLWSYSWKKCSHMNIPNCHVCLHGSLSISVALVQSIVRKESKRKPHTAWSIAKVPLCVAASSMTPKFMLTDCSSDSCHLC